MTTKIGCRQSADYNVMPLCCTTNTTLALGLELYLLYSTRAWVITYTYIASTQQVINQHKSFIVESFLSFCLFYSTMKLLCPNVPLLHVKLITCCVEAIHAVNAAISWQPGEQTMNTQTDERADTLAPYYKWINSGHLYPSDLSAYVYIHNVLQKQINYCIYRLPETPMLPCTAYGTEVGLNVEVHWNNTKVPTKCR